MRFSFEKAKLVVVRLDSCCSKSVDPHYQYRHPSQQRSLNAQPGSHSKSSRGVKDPFSRPDFHTSRCPTSSGLLSPFCSFLAKLRPACLAISNGRCP